MGICLSAGGGCSSQDLDVLVYFQVFEISRFWVGVGFKGLCCIVEQHVSERLACVVVDSCLP